MATAEPLAGGPEVRTPDDPVHPPAMTGPDPPADETPRRIEREGELSRLLDEHERVLVDFETGWCETCRALDPVLAGLAGTVGTPVVRVDVDERRKLAAEYGIGVVPTLVVFEDGEPVDRVTGVQDVDRLRRLLGE